MKKFSTWVAVISAFMLVLALAGCTIEVTVSNRSVSYTTQYGTAPSTISVLDGTVLDESQLPTLTDTTADNAGYKFDGWYDGNTKAVAGSYRVSKDVTLEGKWVKKTLTVTLNKGDNVTSTETVQHGSKLNVTAPTKTGSVFGGYYSAANGGGTKYINSDGTGCVNITQNITLYAFWGYAITYVDPKDADNDNPVVYTGLEAVTLEDLDLESEGYSFDGWYTAATGGTLVTTIPVNSTGAKTFYAHWSPIEYTITYNDEDSELGPYDLTPATFTVETSTFNLPTTSATGYSFDGWYTAATGGTHVTSITSGTIGNKTYYAHWTPIVTQLSVTKADGTPVGTAVYFVGDSFSKAAYTVKAVYMDDTQTTLNANDWSYTGFTTTSVMNSGTMITISYSETYQGNNTVTRTVTIPYVVAAADSLTREIAVDPDDDDSDYIFGDFPFHEVDSSFSANSLTSAPVYNGWYLSNQDGHFYEKVTVNSVNHYYKVEPIKWRALDDDYNHTGNTLLLAYDLIISGIPYYVNTNARGSITANNYKYSTIRAYLNGSYESDDTQTNTYNNAGFLQKAFTTEAQALIEETELDNAYVTDKIFILSKYEVSDAGGYFNGNGARILPAESAYAMIQGLAYDEYHYSAWRLRTPFDGDNSKAYYVASDGDCNTSELVNYDNLGIVPALTISPDQLPNSN